MKQFKNSVGIYNQKLIESKKCIVKMEVFKKLTTKQLAIRKVDRLSAKQVLENAILNIIEFHGKYHPPESQTTRMAFEYGCFLSSH